VRNILVAGAKPYLSLLPYLGTGTGRFRLHIALISNERSVLERHPHPFPALAESGPFGRIMAGDILTDAGSPIRSVFLLRQPDAYPDLSDQIRPVTNPDIDRFWQEAYHWYQSGAVNPSAPKELLLLAGQTDADGCLFPCRSLFYCLLKETYFHPLCPKCGLRLELCCRDGVLESAGLEPYAGSLKRYLYCPDCARKADGATFYVFALQADDPPGLKDRWGLIHDLGNLLVKPGLEDRFPCSTCDQQMACFGPEDLSAGRIVPFAFYPFYLMIFEAATLHAMDFAALLSGATFDRLKGHVRDVGRRHALEAAGPRLSRSSRFLFKESDPRHFLEVLFLKLSFLGELSAWTFQASSSPEYPNRPLSLNRVWLKLPDQTGLLPCLWNFKPMRFDVGLPEYGRPGLLQNACASGLYQLAMAWFYVLLVNERQDIRQVAEILDRICEKLLSSTAPISPFLFQEVNASAFRPENTFWDPAHRAVEPQYDSFWQQTLYLAATLLRAGLNREVRWSRESFNLQFNALRQSIQETLFSRTQGAEPSDTVSGDTEILNILENLSHQWRSPTRQATKMTDKDNNTVTAVPPVDDDLQTTAIFPPKPSVRQSADQHRTPDDKKSATLLSHPLGSSS
jgi:hypothetical protein